MYGPDHLLKTIYQGVRYEHIRMFGCALVITVVLAGCRSTYTSQPPNNTSRLPSHPEFNVAAIDSGDVSDFVDASSLNLNQLRLGKAYTYWEWIDGAMSIDLPTALLLGRTLPAALPRCPC